jgi:hypothetical protein
LSAARGETGTAVAAVVLGSLAAVVAVVVDQML